MNRSLGVHCTNSYIVLGLDWFNAIPTYMAVLIMILTYVSFSKKTVNQCCTGAGTEGTIPPVDRRSRGEVVSKGKGETS